MIYFKMADSSKWKLFNLDLLALALWHAIELIEVLMPVLEIPGHFTPLV